VIRYGAAEEKNLEDEEGEKKNPLENACPAIVGVW
jgi:hypothetical protein